VTDKRTDRWTELPRLESTVAVMDYGLIIHTLVENFLPTKNYDTVDICQSHDWIQNGPIFWDKV